tara:strand:- start:353 stop:1387 length:1035 start_codon:yes stop_codon:yes gene_type:complete
MSKELMKEDWIEAFSILFDYCKIQKNEKTIILKENSSRSLNFELAKYVLNKQSIEFQEIKLNSPSSKIEPIVKSTGSSTILNGNKNALQALTQSDFIIDLTKEGLMHSKETKEILSSGARIMSISDEHPEILSRLKPDPSLKEIVKNAVAKCRKSESMEVTCEWGTNLNIDMLNTNTVGVWGWTDRPGTLAHWPGGLVVSFPNKSSVNGKLVFKPGDMNLTFKRYFESEVIFIIENDYVVDIQGNGTDALLMKSYLKGFNDKDAYATSHVGWGLNKKSRYEALTMYDKNDLNGTELRALAGSFLFSIGANEFAGRYTEGHFDLPVMGCTIKLDNETVVDNGKTV